MAEREYYDYEEWLRSGGDPTYGQGASEAPYDTYVPPTAAPSGGGPPWTLNNPPPSGSAPPGTDWMLNPNTGEFEAIPKGTIPPWGTNVNNPGTPPPPASPTPSPTPPPPGPIGGGPSGTPWSLPSMDWPTFSFGPFDPGPAFSYKDFVAPDSKAMMNDPGFQFRMDQGRKALEASAAGRGVLRSGGTLKDILGYGQNFASQEYGNVYDRALTEYDTNRRNAWDTWNSGYMGRKDKYGFDLDTAKFGHDSRQRQMEFDRDEAFKRWATEGGWLTTLASGVE